jgi:ubiquinone/menaquinone biosynthesis C-methylase UbiE
MDVYGRRQELDATTLDAIVTRLEARGKQAIFAKMIPSILIGCHSRRSGRCWILAAVQASWPGRLLPGRTSEARSRGIDISPVLVEAARRLSREEGVLRINYPVGDTHSLDLPDASFEAVIAHTLVSHVGDPCAVLKEAARLVPSGGWIVAFYGDYASLTLGSEDQDYGARMDAAIIKSIVANPRVMRSMSRLLRGAGLDLVAAIPYVVAEVGKADFWAGLLNSLPVLLPKAGLVGAQEAQAFVDAQFKASADGTFFGSSNFYTYIARRSA